MEIQIERHIEVLNMDKIMQAIKDSEKQIEFNNED